MLALLSLALLATASSPDSAARLAEPKIEVHAVRATSAPEIDGALTEAVWQTATPVTEFTQRDPVEGGKPSQQTEVRVMYDDEAIYIGARMHDTAPDSIIARLTRRDVSIPADRFTVYLDPYHDQRSGYYFQINAAGTLYDGTLLNDDWDDNSWDGVWVARAKRDAQGWTAEFKIPYSQLRFRKTEPMVWGVNFARNIQRVNEGDWVVFRRKNASGFVSRFPLLVGLENVAPRRSIEVLPYVTNKGEFLQHDAGNPFNDGSRYKPDAGGDLRMAVGSGLTLNATVNPDFGQVEVDPAVVNLSDVESFFQEKRPFFVEGASTFDFGQQGASDYWGFNWPQPTFFYSRRIGRAPQGDVDVPDGSFTDFPIGTTILGAAKVIGKLGTSWNFGTLHALTDKEEAKLFSSGLESETEIEPMTYYGVMRGQREFKKRQYGLGAMGTYAARNFQSTRIEDQLNSQSAMTGLDGWAFLDKNQNWVLSGWAAGSYVAGTQERITALQRDPRHYFQRPDASHVEVDPDATSLSGFGSRLWLNKQKGRSFANAAIGFMDPKFDVNDMGFQSRADVINSHAGWGTKWTEVTKSRKYQDVLAAVFGSYDFDGNNTSAGVYLAGSTEFINNYSWNYNSAYNPQTVNNRRTRGGPLTLNMPGYQLGTYFDTDGKSKLFYFIDTYGYTVPEGNSYNWYVNPGVEWKPVSNVLLSVGPTFERVKEYAQYVRTVGDPTATSTYGGRYVFGNLDQKTLSANIRFNVSVTPKLSFQLFAQPLISSGQYTDYKELAQPKTYDFNHYGEGGSTFDPVTHVVDPDGPSGPAQPFSVGFPDFNFKSLRGNAVLRWEYLPGSTFYLVWTQERSDFEDDGVFRLGHDSHRLIDAQPDNIFLAKVSYYLSL